MKQMIGVVVVVFILLFVAGCTASKSGEEDATAAMKKENTVMMEKETNTVENMKYEGNLLAGTTSPYREFTKADYNKAIAEGKVILLYFYANWCPLCKAEQQETFAAFNELQEKEIIGFRVNYKDSDTNADEEALAKEFGIAYQHTKVILKDGKKVLKAPDSWDKQRYLDELTKVV